jgi:hypothetical protein
MLGTTLLWSLSRFFADTLDEEQQPVVSSSKFFTGFGQF